MSQYIGTLSLARRRPRSHPLAATHPYQEALPAPRGRPGLRGRTRARRRPRGPIAANRMGYHSGPRRTRTRRARRTRGSVDPAVPRRSIGPESGPGSRCPSSPTSRPRVRPDA